MNSDVTLVVVVLCWFALNGLLFVVINVALAGLLRIGVGEVGIGFAPHVIRFCWSGTHWKVGLLPIGTHVTLLGDHNREQYPNVPESKRRLSEVALWKQLLLAFSNPIVLCGIAVALQPIQAATHHFLNGLPQLVGGAIDPFGEGQELLARFAALAGKSPTHAIAILSAKVLPWTLLPFLGSHSYTAIYLIGVRLGFNAEGGATTVGPLRAAVLWLPSFLPYVGWLIAVGYFLAK